MQAEDFFVNRLQYTNAHFGVLQMPIMDGLRATDLIRKAERENSWTRVPVLGLTAHAIQGYQEICLQHGMDGYLGKPFDIHQLLKTIGHLLPPDRLCPQL